jgi:2-amino-4-hydroxy-6-hydroxymethyldihydropteridine diphosphokinase
MGSNVSQVYNMQMAVTMMMSLLGKSVIFSRRVWTTPIGFDSDKFLNCIAVAYTDQGMPQLVRAFKDIEHRLGSMKSEHSAGVVKIDIDVLQYGDQRFHASDWNRDYIKALMKEMDL